MSDNRQETNGEHRPADPTGIESGLPDTVTGSGDGSGKKLVAGLIVGLVAILLLTSMVWAMMIRNAPEGEVTNESASVVQQPPKELPMAPDLVLNDNFGRTVTLTGAMPTPRFYYFWATWCSVCRSQNPLIKAAYQKYGAKIDFYAVNLTSTEDPDTLKQWIADDPFPFVMLFDPQNTAGEAYAVRATPTQFFISKSGKIIEQTFSLTPDELDQKLASLLSQE